MTSWTSLPTEEAFITLRALSRVALTIIPTYWYRFKMVAELPHKGMHPDDLAATI